MEDASYEKSSKIRIESSAVSTADYRNLLRGKVYNRKNCKHSCVDLGVDGTDCAYCSPCSSGMELHDCGCVERTERLEKSEIGAMKQFEYAST